MIKKHHAITEPNFQDSRMFRDCIKAAVSGHTSSLELVTAGVRVLLLFDNFFWVWGGRCQSFPVPEKMVIEYLIFSPELLLQNGRDLPEGLKLSIETSRSEALFVESVNLLKQLQDGFDFVFSLFSYILLSKNLLMFHGEGIGMEARASCMLGNHSVIRLHPQPRTYWVLSGFWLHN